MVSKIVSKPTNNYLEPKQFDINKKKAYGEKCWFDNCKRIPDKVIVSGSKASYTCWCHNFSF
jgi:hypothetical protein